MRLSERQRLFTRLVGRLIEWAFEHDFELTFGEAYRTQEQQELHRAAGRSWVKRSLHQDRLAVDFNLFLDDEYQADSEAYRSLGEYWESLHPACRWGGRFGDGNHFELRRHDPAPEGS